jgi:2-dehydro-3-deoxy-D-arabinonate dehydratase
MLLYRTSRGAVAVQDGRCYAVAGAWDELVNDDALGERLARTTAEGRPDSSLAAAVEAPLAPLESQEVWAAGVTYFRSREARMKESQDAGGGDFYDRVYTAPRPELFLKATPHRVVGPGQAMHLRSDSRWIVPEPELTLVVTASGKIVGFTIGNDLSCRDIEGENPLYLPQAKTFDRCAAIGPAILVAAETPAPTTAIRIVIRRGGGVAFEGATTLAQLKRKPEELVSFLFRDNRHPRGCLLMTGAGIVPPDDFCLQPRDLVEIEIDGIGRLVNPME